MAQTIKPVKLSNSPRAASVQFSDFSNLFHLSLLGTMVTDENNQIIYVNPAFEKLTGYPASEVCGQTPALLQSDQHNSDFYEAMWQSVRDRGTWQGEVWNRKKSGDIYPELLSINRIVDGSTGDIHHLGLLVDLSCARRGQGVQVDEAMRDARTGLANNLAMRRHIERLLAMARMQLRSVAVLYIDLDGLQTVNDLCGQQQGQCVLKSFIQTIQSIIRENDLFARAKGDEFVVALGMADCAESVAFELADKIFSHISTLLENDFYGLNVRCSIGISIYPGNADTFDELIRAAEMAMHEAKSQGGGCLFNFTKSWVHPVDLFTYSSDPNLWNNFYM
ncbi:diguanylate cyclase (GGDEF)-like protein/PAS domain S-box-containing protein [Oxalobacteraceae bacterium GrIS 2.11]